MRGGRRSPGCVTGPLDSAAAHLLKSCLCKGCLCSPGNAYPPSLPAGCHASHWRPAGACLEGHPRLAGTAPYQHGGRALRAERAGGQAGRDRVQVSRRWRCSAPSCHAGAQRGCALAAAAPGLQQRRPETRWVPRSQQRLKLVGPCVAAKRCYIRPLHCRYAFLVQTVAPCAGLPPSTQPEPGCQGCFAVFVTAATTAALVRAALLVSSSDLCLPVRLLSAARSRCHGACQAPVNQGAPHCEFSLQFSPRRPPPPPTPTPPHPRKYARTRR